MIKRILEPWFLMSILVYRGLEFLYAPDNYLAGPVTQRALETFSSFGLGIVHLVTGLILLVGIIFKLSIIKFIGYSTGALIASFWCWTAISPLVGGDIKNSLLSYFWFVIMLAYIGYAKEEVINTEE